MARGRRKNTDIAVKTKLTRLPPDMAEQLSAIAWYQRQSISSIAREVLGDVLRKEYERLPKAIRDRASREIEKLSKPIPTPTES